MKCANCANALDDDALVCSQCGAVVGASYGPPPQGDGFAPTSPSPPAPLSPPALSGSSRSASLVTSLASRVKAILVTPKTEWPIIADENTLPRAIYIGYVAPLAAIGAVALFVAHVIIGTPLPLIGLVRASVGAGIVAATLTFAMALISVWVLAQIIDALAPNFGGQRDSLGALKASAYSYTPAFLAGVFHLIPAWDALALPMSLYGLYLMYLGLPVLMRCPPQRAGPYTGVLVACAIVLFFLFGGLTTCVAGFGPGVFS